MQKPDLNQFPTTPGVYLYKDSTGLIIYVGKARRLRHRLASYFQDSSKLPIKTVTMLRHAVSIDILQTSTEKEALLLEASLIKKHRPRYNIVLRDDKEYLLFRISSSHPYPRVEIVRNNSKNRKRTGDKFFGPFSSGTSARETHKLILKYFPLRRCKDILFKNRTRPCLYHHMGQCLAPCVLPVEPSEYRKVLHKVEMLLASRSSELINLLHQEMLQFSEALAFEKAAQIRDQIKAVERTLERQSVVLPSNFTLDLIGVAQTPEGLALGVVFVRDGLLLDGRNFFWAGLGVEDTPELLSSFISQFYLAENNTPPPRIVVPWLPKNNTEPIEKNEPLADSHPQETLLCNPQVTDSQDSFAEMFSGMLLALEERRGGSVQITVPKSVDEDTLAILAASNAKEAQPSRNATPMSERLASRLSSPKPLERIEVVDISHTSGEQTRAGMVVFLNEQAEERDFRTYALDADLLEAGAEQGDDYAALAIWARRRANAGAPWADLVLIDGGKGQLQAVHKAFTEAGVIDNFVLAAITKARDEEGHQDRRAGNVADRIFLPNRSNPVNFSAGSAELLFLQRIRDAAHDFVLGKHRQARSAASFNGELTRLPGIGASLAKSLFEHFESLANMAKASEEELAKVPGIGKARAKMLAKRLSILVGK